MGQNKFPIFLNPENNIFAEIIVNSLKVSTNGY